MQCRIVHFPKKSMLPGLSKKTQHHEVGSVLPSEPYEKEDPAATDCGGSGSPRIMSKLHARGPCPHVIQQSSSSLSPSDTPMARRGLVLFMTDWESLCLLQNKNELMHMKRLTQKQANNKSSLNATHQFSCWLFQPLRLDLSSHFHNKLSSYIISPSVKCVKFLHTVSEHSAQGRKSIYCSPWQMRRVEPRSSPGPLSRPMSHILQRSHVFCCSSGMAYLEFVKLCLYSLGYFF